MRRVATMLALLAILGFGSGALADHVPAVPDALDCTNAAAGIAPTTTAETDRGAVCVSDGNAANGAELYVGGDAQTESDYPDTPENDTGEPCGAVVVGGRVGSATRPDDPATAANEALDWDWMHNHGTIILPIWHHHTCN